MLNNLARTHKIKIGNLVRHYHFVFAVAIVLVFFVIEAWFLYQNFYQTLNESKIVRELKQQAAIEQIDLEGFNRLEQFYEQKRQKPAVEWELLADPFQR